MADLEKKRRRQREWVAAKRKAEREADLVAKGVIWTPDTRASDDTPEARERALGMRIRRLEDDLREATRRFEAAEKGELDAERVRETIFGLAGRTPAPPSWLVEASTGGSAPGVPVAMWSDWHWGETVQPAETGGVNRFDRAVALHRAELLAKTTVSLCFDHMVRPEYPGIVVALGGDMVTGDIHEELQQTNDGSTLEAILDLVDTLSASLTLLADQFGRVFVPCVVGNHGRSTKRVRMKGRAVTNFDWLTYCLLERTLAGDDRIRFQIPEGADAHFRVYGHRFMLTHGDSLGARGGDGIIGALGPIMRGRLKTATSEAQIGQDFDTLLIGHWHQYISLPGLVVNGSLKGYDEFTRLGLRAPYQRPTQALFFVHQKHGITCSWPVFLEPTPAAKQSAEWLTWSAA